MSLSVLAYKWLIDPLLSGLRRSVRQQVQSGSTLLDIACGTGSLIFSLKDHCSGMVGIDLDAPKIAAAQRTVEVKGLSHLSFRIMDATHLEFPDQHFDYVHLSMAIHQFDPQLRLGILAEAVRVGKQVIVADYSCPLPASIAGWIASKIEWLAGEEHYRNFIDYQKKGGMPGLLNQAGIPYLMADRKGSGVFELYLLSSTITG